MQIDWHQILLLSSGNLSKACIQRRCRQVRLSPLADWEIHRSIDLCCVYRFKIHNGLLSIDNNYTLDALSLLLSAIVIVDVVVLFIFAISHTQPILNFIFMIIGSTSSTIYRYFLHTHSKQFRRQRSKKIKRQRQPETLEVQQTFFLNCLKLYTL